MSREQFAKVKAALDVYLFQIARRDPLHDQYVILYFSGEGKFTRMFSNVADISPIFPRSTASWRQLMWGEGIKAQ